MPFREGISRNSNAQKVKLSKTMITIIKTMAVLDNPAPPLLATVLTLIMSTVHTLASETQRPIIRTLTLSKPSLASSSLFKFHRQPNVKNLRNSTSQPSSASYSSSPHSRSHCLHHHPLLHPPSIPASYYFPLPPPQPSLPQPQTRPPSPS